MEWYGLCSGLPNENAVLAGDLLLSVTVKNDAGVQPLTPQTEETCL